MTDPMNLIVYICMEKSIRTQRKRLSLQMLDEDGLKKFTFEHVTESKEYWYNKFSIPQKNVFYFTCA